MTRSLSILLKALKWAVIVILALAALLTAIISGFAAYQYLMQPPITRGLPNEIAKAEQVFAKRVSAAFPAGISVEALKAELEKQGFTVQDAASSVHFANDGFPCRQEWLIQWRPDAGGHVQDIQGHYMAICL